MSSAFCKNGLREGTEGAAQNFQKIMYAVGPFSKSGDHPMKGISAIQDDCKSMKTCSHSAICICDMRNMYVSSV